MSKVRVILKPGGFITLSLIAMALVIIGVFIVAIEPEWFAFLKLPSKKPVAVPSAAAPAPAAAAAVSSSLSAKLPPMAKPLTQWLLLRPLPTGVTLAPNRTDNQRKASMAQMLGNQELPNEAQLDPQPNGHVVVNKQTLTWNPVTAASLDLTTGRAYSLSTTGPDNAVGYAVTSVTVPAAVTNATLYLGSDDGVVVWLNGKEIWRNATVRVCNPADDKVTNLPLKAGRNVLVFKVGQDGGEWRLNAALEQP